MWYLRMLAKLTTMSAMKRPTMPKTPPLAPTSARHVSSNATLKKLPAHGSSKSGITAAWLALKLQPHMQLQCHGSCTTNAVQDPHCSAQC